MNENGSFIKEEFEKAKTYWRDRFPGEITEINLPCDFQRSPVYKRSDYKISFNKDISAKLLSLSKNQDILLYIVLLSVLKFLMFKYMNNGDISIGAPIYSEKDLSETSKRLIIFRDLLFNQMTFKELLLKVKQTVLEGYENQHYVIEDILDALGVTIPLKPLSKVILLLENIHKKEIISDITQSPANDITISILKSGNELAGSIEYNSTLFKEDTIKRISLHYLNSLEQILNNINIKLSGIDILSHEEKKQIIYDFNNTAVVYPVNKTVIDLLADQVEQVPDKIAVVEEDFQLTYGELNCRVNRRASLLKSGGVTANVMVGLILDDSLEIVTSIFGVLKAGGAYLPIDPTQPWERKKYLLKDCSTTTLIIQEDIKETLPDLAECFSRVNILVVSRHNNHFSSGEGENYQKLLRGVQGGGFLEKSPPGRRRQDPTDLAYAIYTSGTTGWPKGVLVHHQGIINYTSWRLKTYGLTPADVTLQMLPYYFDGFCSNFYSGLLSGGTLVMISDARKLDPDYIRASVKKCVVTNMSVVPPMYRMILTGAEAGELRHLRFVVLAGEKTGVNLIKKSKEIAPDTVLVNEYGPSEITVTAAGYWGMNEFYSHVIGHPISNTHIYILDPALKFVPINVNGELCVAGPGVAWGYLNKPELTEETFTVNPLQKGGRIYHTGDLARWRSDGNIEIIGRLDQQVKIRGYRIELSEIENRLNRIETIKEAVVREYKQSEEENYLCAYFVSNHVVDITELRGILSNDLPDYMVPSFFVQLEKIPLTPNGKPDRKALPSPQIKTQAEIVAPRNRLEEELVKIWAEVLGVEKDIIGIDSNFFDLGGHSLKATIMISKVHKELNVKLPLAEIFKAPRIKDLAKYFKESKGDVYVDIKPLEKRQYYPQSSAQKRLYILNQMDFKSTAYNIPETFPLSGDLDIKKLEETFKKLSHRHESLRTSLHLIADEPVQRVHDDVEFKIEYFNFAKAEENHQFQITNPKETGGYQSLMNRILHHFVRPFVLDRSPLLRVGLAELPSSIPALRHHPPQEGGDHKYILMVDMHHIISDGVSHEILIKDFMTFYEGNQLSPLRIQYKDFAGWQKGIKEKEKNAIKQQEEYWLSHFAEEIPVLNLPNDYKRPERQSHEGSSLGFVIGKPETQGLNRLAKAEGVTLYMVVMAIFNVLLSKIGGQEDIVIGTGAAGRRHADLQHIIGFFVNTLPVRNYPLKEKTFKEFLQEVKKITLGAFENQDYPFEDLVEKLELPRDTSRNPLFDVMFVFQNIEQYLKTGNIPNSKEEITVGPDEFKILPAGHEAGMSKFDLTLFASQTNERLSFTFEYSIKLFKPETIEIFILHFRDIISAVLQDPGKKLWEIKDIPPEKKSRLLFQWNEELKKEIETITRKSKKVLQDKLNESIHKFKDRTAIEYQPKSITYGQLGHDSDFIAHQLLRKGIKKGTFIGILIENRWEFICALLGILKAGSVFVVLDVSYPQKRVEEMIRCTGTKLIITTGDNFNRWASLEVEGQSLEWLWLEELLLQEKAVPAAVRPEVPYSPDDEIYIYFTSGSTGTPQALLGKNSSLAHFIDWEIDTFGITKNHRFSQFITPGFDAFLRDIFVPLCAGGTVCIPGNQEIMTVPGALKEWLETSAVHLIHFVPSLFRLLNTCELTADNLGTLKFILLSGEKITPSDLVGWYNIFHERIQLVNLWGTSETTLAKTYYFLRETDINRERIPVGKPLTGARVLVLDEKMNPGDRLVKGELYIQTPFRTFGYYNSPDLNQERFIRNPFSDNPDDLLHRTGDLGRILADGSIDVMGRNDRQVKIRGIRVELEEIERVLLKCPGTKEAVVIVKNELLCAYITVTGKEAPDSITVKEYLDERLPRYMVPAKIVPLEEIPRRPNGKVDYNALPHPLAEEESRYQPPRDPVEEKLAELWFQVLGLVRSAAHQPSPRLAIGIRNNFFELGGNSLNIIVLLAKIHQEFAVKLPVTEIFKNPYIEKQAALIKTARKEKFVAVEAVEQKEYYPLSSAQKRLYFFYQLVKESTAYNMPQIIPLSAEPDTSKLAETFIKLIKRHESLRTSFVTVNEVPMQKVQDEVKFEIEYYGSSYASAIKNFIRPFDFSLAPLLRVGLAQWEPNRCLLLVDMHHIISDGVSMEILIKDFTILYTEKTLPELRVQYKDFTVWQNKEKENLEHQEKFWLREFEDEIPILNLPTDFTRPSLQSFEGDTEKFKISAADTGRLKTIALRDNVTLYMILLAVFNILFAKLSNREDVVIGTPVAGRRHVDLEKIIGIFVNTLALRNFPRGEQTFREFLMEVKEKTLQAFENQDYQYEDLVEKVSVNRDPGRNPLFDVMYIYQNYETNTRNMPTTHIPLEHPGNEKSGENQGPDEYRRGISKFDMNFTGVESGEEMAFEVQYSTKLFKKETIIGFINYLKNITAAIAGEPGKKIKEIDILTEKEKYQILYDFNDTAADYPKDKPLHGLFAEQAEQIPDHLAIVGPGYRVQGLKPAISAGTSKLSPWSVPMHLTYNELNQKSNRLTQVLREKRIQPGIISGIMVERSIEMVIGILGILKAGGAYLPIDPLYPAERKKYMLVDSNTRVLLSDVGKGSEVMEGIEWVDLPITMVENEGTEPTHLTNITHLTDPHQLCYVIYTSGSTGRPKGTAVKHSSFINLVYSHQKVFKEGPGDRISQVASPGFDAMAFEVWPCLLNGGTLFIADNETRMSPDQLKEWLIDNKITISFQPTVMAEQLLMKKWPQRGVYLRALRAAGEQLTRYPTPHHPFRLYNLYGPTEDTVWSTWAEVEVKTHQIHEKYPPIGKPIANHRIYIMNPTLRLQPPGIPGELCIAGEGVAVGYLNRPELTAEKFLGAFNDRCPGSNDRLYRSGDLGRWLPDGQIEFLGRIDSQVKIRGYRIELGEIQSRFLEYPGITEAAVIARENRKKEKYLCGYFVSEKEIELPKIRTTLSQCLPDYMIPSYLVRLERLPVTNAGKIDPGALPEPEIGAKEYVAPRNALEEQLAEIWAQVLGLEKNTISIDSGFFELGGHSLKATNLTAKIHKKLEVKIPLAEIFKTPTIKGLSSYIKAAAQDRYTSIKPIEKRQYYAVSSAQKRLYILQRLALDSTAYNLPRFIPLSGEPPIEKLKEAFLKLIKRHESLRTSFFMIDETPVQKVHEADEVGLEIEPSDLAPGEETSPARTRNPNTMIKNFNRPFDLSRAPLLRLGLAALDDNHHLLMVDMHHIISDAVSMEILEEDFMALYEGKPLPRLRIQYKDFTGWHNKEKENLEFQERYWLKEFKADIPVPNLPLDFPRSALQASASHYVPFNIGKLETKTLKKIALDEGGTIFILLLTILNVMLAKISGQHDIIIGTDSAGRQHDDLQRIIGMFINTLPLRNFPTPAKTFKAFLAEVKEKTLQAFDNQNYPFEDLVKKVAVNRDAGRNPIFDVMFSFKNIESEAQQIPGDNSPSLNLMPGIDETMPAKFDLTLNAADTGAEILCSFQYAAALFRKETIERFVSHFKQIVLSIIKNPDSLLGEIEMISEEQNKELLKMIENQKPKKISTIGQTVQKPSSPTEAEFDF